MRNYYKFSDYLKMRFGCRVHKISIDAGFSCPNLDGTKSVAGCIYCDNNAFSLNTPKGSKSIEAQIEEGMNRAKLKYKAEKFIVYFQAYTNTYAPLEVLKEKYSKVKKFNDVVSIAIGTRPDCINEEILNLIDDLSNDYEVWLEYGLQSIHNGTLQCINRGHKYEDFLTALEMTKKRKRIKICAHTIIGLPYETKADVMETAKILGSLKLDGIKVHPLYIIKGTKLEEMFNDGKYKPLKASEYVNMVSSFLEYIPMDTVIQRITADCPKEYLLAPKWINEKNRLLESIERKLLEKGQYQGRLHDESAYRASMV